MPLIDIVLPEYDREIEITRLLITAAPEAELEWRPATHTRSLAELLAHLAEIPGWIDNIMAHDGYDLTDAPEPSRVDAVAQLREWFDRNAAIGRTRLLGRLNRELNATWTLTRRGRTVFSLPRISLFRVLVLNHLIHHRGQLSIYLRMLGARLPSIYGPTAGGVDNRGNRTR